MEGKWGYADQRHAGTSALLVACPCFYSCAHLYLSLCLVFWLLFSRLAARLRTSDGRWRRWRRRRM